MNEQWQLYDNQGRPLKGQGASKDDTHGKGLLHGASHVWIWRKTSDLVEVLLQKRVADKRTWPNMYDISAAGHIDLGEDTLTAAIRETVEEIGLRVEENDLELIAVHRTKMSTTGGSIENEFRWIYILKIEEDIDFKLEESEVESLTWIALEDFKKETINNKGKYVPHGSNYFNMVISNIELASKR